jgi:FkbM family methyltransferase
MTTVELLSETVGSARLREATVFAELRKNAGGKIALFGAGHLGRKTLEALRRAEVEPAAFVDNDHSLHGTQVDGVPVWMPAAAAERLGGDGLFVVTTFLPHGGGVRSRLDELAALGCRHSTSFLAVGWMYEGVLPHFGADRPSRLLARAPDLVRVAGLWCDDQSRETYRRQLEWRLLANFGPAERPAPHQYFPRDIIRPNPNESFVDGGAFDGDTLRSAPWEFARILAIEPDPASAQKLRNCAGATLTVHEKLLGGAAGSARFNGGGTMASCRSDSGALEIPIVTLDQLTHGERPTFIKLDVEGDELRALQGGRKTLRECQPVVAVCAYHRPEDLWTLPLFLHETLPAHRLYLRAHAGDGFELVVYAVPEERCQKST